MNATMLLEKTKHYPVMLDQILSIISPQRGGTFVDCTFGGGGYSKAILKFPDTKVVGIDRDIIAKSNANSLSKKFPKRFYFFQDKFSNINKIIKKNLKPKAIIFDLGLSSFQLADEKRGFSFNSKKSLNMEMGLNNRSAYDVVNSLDKEYLAKIIKILGDEKDGKLIANGIDRYRKNKLIKTSEELANIIKMAKKSNRNYKKNPATKTFQALRIFVNNELTELILGLIQATKILSNNGMLIVISFHSLEDKIVKNFFNFYSNVKKNPSRYLPPNEDKKSLFNKILKKPLTPSQEELEENIRSRSGKLRYAIRNKNLFFQTKEFEKKFKNYFQLEEAKL